MLPEAQIRKWHLGKKTTFYLLILNAPTPKCCGFGNMPDLTFFSQPKQPDLLSKRSIFSGKTMVPEFTCGKTILPACSHFTALFPHLWAKSG
jgi:hypothetical protein